jgi:hypothetical protein
METEVKEAAKEAKLTPQEASRIMRERIQERRTALEATGEVSDHRISTLLRYPRLVAHLICHSLGYFCPKSAAMAIHRYKDSQPMFCEWYAHMAQWDEKGEKRRPESNDEEHARLIRIGKEALLHSFKNRHSHKGYMADYWQARIVCYSSLKGKDPLFASWF